MSSDHDNPVCAALGHYVATVTVVYCPHRQAWLAVWHAGDESDDRCLEAERCDFGPFDSTDDVARRVTSVLSMLVRVTSRRWLSQRQEDGPTAG